MAQPLLDLYPCRASTFFMCIYSCGIVTSERMLPHYGHKISEGPSWYLTTNRCSVRPTNVQHIACQFLHAKKEKQNFIGMHYHRVIGDIGALFSSSYLMIAHKLLQLSVQWLEGSFRRIVPIWLLLDPFRIKSSLHDGSLKYDDGDMRKQKGNQATYWNKASKGDTGTRVPSFPAGIADKYFPVSRNAESMCISQHSPSDRGDVQYNLIETTGPLLFGMITVQNPVESYSHSL
ncbi:hypothetical protein ARMGADRAFT_1038401 [Armillaria gallica]|uniref:Uncharacterized protein n=1 Tax=Armillaria gallica TaxID=47427 RepID=A0A2H3D330_ARMGA|nr:hypothetical protein ARMGADRAFT_1038401 [Armillaria gallica]